MKSIHSIRIKAFSNEDEVNNVRQSIYNILPDGSRDKEIKESKIEPESDACVFTEQLRVLELNLNRQGDIKSFTNTLLGKLKKYDKEKLSSEITNRIDDDCNFYIRLSKKDAMDKKFKLWDDDPIQIKIKIATFPKNKNNAIEMAMELLK